MRQVCRRRMKEGSRAPLAVRLDTVTEYAIRLVHNLATPHGIANNGDVGDNIADLLFG